MTIEILNSIFNQSELKGSSISVTLNVRGSIVSGDLISVESYVEQLSEYLKTIDDSEEGKKVGGIIVNLLEKKLKELTISGNDFMASRYICLRDVYLYPAGTKWPFWCGLMGSIDGFTLGRVGA